jgi:broad specificity phosphatase PhoE
VPLRIVLVRHGQSSFNLEQRIQGRDDRSTLTETGRNQARLAGQALADLPLDAVYSSPLSRARDTATLLLEAHGGGMSPQLDDGLLEIDLAPWSGLLRRELIEVDPEGERLWREAPEALELKRADGSRYRPVQELMAQAGGFVDRLLRTHADLPRGSCRRRRAGFGAGGGPQRNPPLSLAAAALPSSQRLFQVPTGQCLHFRAESGRNGSRRGPVLRFRSSP